VLLKLPLQGIGAAAVVAPIEQSRRPVVTVCNKADKTYMLCCCHRHIAYMGPGPSRLSSSGAQGSSGAYRADPGVVTGACDAQQQQQQQQQQSDVKPVQEPSAGGSGGSSVAASAATLQQQQQQAVADAGVLKRFMEAHCSQLTSYGLLQLSDKLKEHQLAVFFR